MDPEDCSETMSVSSPSIGSCSSDVDRDREGCSEAGEWLTEVTSPQEPRLLNTEIHPRFVEILTDKLTAKYTALGNHQLDFGSVRSDNPIPPGLFLFYYEVTVLSSGKSGCITIGLAPEPFPLVQQVGSSTSSYGYHGANGNKLYNSSRGSHYAEKFTTGDIIGCGVNFHTNEIFFAKNGKHLGVAFTELSGELYPVVSLHSTDESVKVNFGGEKFKFDLEGTLANERASFDDIVSRISIESSLCVPLISDYLLFNGYADTLKILESKAGWKTDPDKSKLLRDSLDQRKALRSLITSGRIDESIGLLSAVADGKVLENTRVMFALHCQQFVEFVRRGEIEPALRFAQTVLVKYKNLDEVDQTQLEDVMTLLAFVDPKSSHLGHYFDRSSSESVADLVNYSLVIAMGTPRHPSILSQLMNQLLTVDELRRSENSNMGEPLSLMPE
eukprot:197927_1